MNTIDISFQVTSPSKLPVDHSYALIGAVSRLIPAAHGNNGFAIAPISGQQIGERQMKLDHRSRFVIRTSTDQIAKFLPLAGKTIDLQGRKLVLGVPSIYQLLPSQALRARLVTIKGFFETGPFQEAVRRQLDLLETGSCRIEVGRKRTLRIKQREIIGFETTLSELSDADSLLIAANGIGGRRHMGCGFFVSCKLEANNV
jgi:CRISPR-associated protein Cas6